MDDPSHFLELRAKDGGWNREFQNFDELQEWAVAEQQAWSWIWSGPVTNDGALKSLAGHYKTVLGNIQNKISQWKPKLNDEESRQQAEDYLKEHYEAESIVAAESAKGVFIADLRDNVGPMAAAAAVAYWRGQSLSPTDSTQLRGAIEAALFSNEIGRTRSRVAEETMNDLLSRFGASLGEQETKQQTLFGRLEKALGNYSDLRDRGTRWFAARIGHYDSRIGDVAEDGRQRFSEVQKLFSDAMALRAPVSYWRAKQKRHEGLALNFFLVFAGYLLFGSLLFVRYRSRFGISDFDPADVRTFAAFGASFLIAAVAIWIARILLRIAMSQLHLWNDAEERVTMVETYLALREGGAASDREMELALPALFRNSADGIVKDDVTPFTPLDIVRNMNRPNR